MEALEDVIIGLRAQIAMLRRELSNEDREIIDTLKAENQRLRQENEHLSARIARMQKAVEMRVFS